MTTDNLGRPVAAGNLPSFEPMVPYLAGWLASCVMSKASECMKVLEVQPDVPDAFTVTFASGLVLRVEVKVAK